MMTRIAAIALVSMLASVTGSGAQTYPTRPITIIVPFAAGGPTDTLARILGPRMGALLGQTVVIENVTGASGSIGAGHVARSAPDGYTLVIGHWGTHVLNGAIYTLPYDIVRDFQPVALLATNPQLIVGNNSLPPKDLHGLITWLKDNPDKATFGAPAPVPARQIAALLFANMTGTKFQIAPYRGTGPALGRSDGGPHRSDVRSSVELDDAGAWRLSSGLCGHRQDPPAIGPRHPDRRRSRPVRTLRRLLARPVGAQGHAKGHHCQIKRRHGRDLGRSDGGRSPRRSRSGIPPRAQQTPEALGAYQRAEIDKWWPIVKAANIRGE